MTVIRPLLGGAALGVVALTAGAVLVVAGRPWVAWGLLLAATVAQLLLLRASWRRAHDPAAPAHDHDVEAQLRRALAAEREAAARIIEVDRAKGDFVSAVSHELRTPLTSIVGYIELLEDDASGTLDRTQQELVERIDRNSQRLLRLVEDLLVAARVQEGLLQPSRQWMDLRHSLSYALDASGSAARSGGVRLRAELPSVPVEVDGDDAQLERLAVSLISNAVKFTPAGGQVSVTLERAGDEAVLVVRDTGVGIPEQDQGRLFERFYRSDLAATMAVQGTGLGLTIAQSIAEAHEGRVEIESLEGEGTTARFSMPLQRGAAEQDAPTRVARIPARDETGASALVASIPEQKDPLSAPAPAPPRPV